MLPGNISSKIKWKQNIDAMKSNEDHSIPTTRQAKSENSYFRVILTFLLKLFVYVVLFVIILIVGTWALLQNYPIRDYATPYLLNVLEAKYPIEIEVDRISGNLLTQISFENLRITGADGVILEADQITIDFLPQYFLDNVLFIQTVKVINGKLNLERKSDGSWSIPKLARDDRDKSSKRLLQSIAIIIHQFEFVNTDILFTTQTEKGEVIRHVANIECDALVNIDEQIALNIFELSFDIGPDLIPEASVRGRVVYMPETNALSLIHLTAKTKASLLRIHGGITDLKKSDSTMDFLIDLDNLSLKDLDGLFDLKGLKQGSIKAQLDINGNPKNFYHTLDLEWERLRLKTSGRFKNNDHDDSLIEVSGSIQHLNPASFLESESSPMIGDINGEFDVKGTNLHRHQGRRGLITLNFDSSQWLNLSLNEGTLSVSILEDKIRVNDCKVMTSCGDIDGYGDFNGFMDRSLPKDFRVNASVRGFNSVCMGLKIEEKLLGRLDGELEINASIPPDDFNKASIKFAAHIAPFTIANIKINTARLNGFWDRGQLKIEELTMENQAGSLSMEGTLLPQLKTMNLNGDLKIPDVRNAVSLFSKGESSSMSWLEDYEQINGQLQLSTKISGWINQLQVNTELAATGLTYKKIKADSFNLKGTWSRFPENLNGVAEWRIDDLSFENHTLSKLTGISLLSKNQVEVETQITHETGVEVIASGRTTDWRKPTKDVTLNKLEIQCEGPALINLAPISISLSPDSINIESFDLASKEGTISVHGRLEESGKEFITINVDNTDLRYITWFHLIDQEIQGYITGTGQIGSWWDHPEITATLRGNALNFQIFSTESIEISGKWKGSPNDFSANLEAVGENIQVNNYKLPMLSTNLNFTPEFVKGNIHGHMEEQENVKIKGNLQDWTKPEKQLTLTSLLVETKDFNAVNQGPIIMKLTPKALDITPFKMALNTIELSLCGKILSNGDENLSLSLKNLNLNQLLQFLPEGNQMEGSAAAELKLTGNLEAPILSGNLSVSEGVINGQPLSNLNLTFGYEKGRLSLMSSAHQEGKEIMSLDGKVSLMVSFVPFKLSPLTEALDINFAVNNLSPLIFPISNRSEFEVDGILSANTHIGGNLKNPSLTGQLSLKDGFLNLKKTNLSYENLSGECIFSPGKITIDSLVFQGEKEGTITGSGYLTYEGIQAKAFNLKLGGTHIYAPFQKAINARIEPDLALSGTMASPQLSGTIMVSEGRINLDRLANRGLSEVRVVSDEPSGENHVITIDQEPVQLSFAKLLSADVILDIPGNTWIKDRDMNVEISGNLELKKEPKKKFTLVGSLKSVRGTYSSRGKLFKLTNGNITFIGLEEPNPNLDIEAVTRINSNNIIIRIGGTAKDLKVSFDSEPKMSQSDIISYLIFGKKIDSLEGQQAFNSQKAALKLDR